MSGKEAIATTLGIDMSGPEKYRSEVRDAQGSNFMITIDRQRHGGTAFPSLYGASDGMSLRDYFAAKAMAAKLRQERHQFDEDWARETVARQAYQIADAMLAERAK